MGNREWKKGGGATLWGVSSIFEASVLFLV
jgi:hypothetical protein